MDQRPSRVLAAIGLALGALLGAGAAPAADLYLQGNIHTSYGRGESEVDADLGGFNLSGSGSDDDTSPVYGVAGGLSFRLDEVNPDGWGERMPPFKVRMELEWMGAHSYDFVTEAGPSAFFGEVDAWTLTPNLWMHFPVHTPLERWTGRIPLLEPLSLYAGGGLGLTKLKYQTTDNISAGKDSELGFTWHVGAGIDYEVNDWIDLSLGYRYEDLGQAKADLELGGTTFGQASADLTAHALRFGVRVDLYSAPLDEMIPERWPVPDLRRLRWPRWLGGR